jgi:hypothetical protein
MSAIAERQGRSAGPAGRPPGTTQGRSAARLIPVAEHRSWPAWILAGMLLLIGAAGVFGEISLIRDGFGMPLSWLHQTPLPARPRPGLRC